MSKQQTVIRNIIGEVEEDPTCDFSRCYHKFSVPRETFTHEGNELRLQASTQ